MTEKLTSILTCLLLVAIGINPSVTLGQPELIRTQPAMPDFQISRESNARGRDGLDKMSPELRSLYEQFANARGGPITGDESGLRGYTAGQLSNLFGIAESDREPIVSVVVQLTEPNGIESIKRVGGTIVARTNRTAYVMIALQSLGEVSRMATVSSIGILKASHRPSPTTEVATPRFEPLERGGAGSTVRLASDFAKQGLTGKGVIVGVIDSGIDWRHEDFIRPDGTSRILAIWDLSDNSYQDTNGKTGSKPPVYMERTKRWLGTVYTNKQINDALKGLGEVKSTDRFGHGTAVAGTAVGNGRATGNGVPPGTYAGVATEADLIVVKAMDCGFFFPMAPITSEWIAESAKALGRPVVTNMSFGSQWGAHDGSSEEELFIDSIVGGGKRGHAITIAAGNDGRYSVHANGKFGPKTQGQKDNFSEPVELTVNAATVIMGVFDSRDDWGLAFKSDSPVFKGADGKPAPIFVVRNYGKVEVKTASEMKDPNAFRAFSSKVGGSLSNAGSINDLLQLQLPAGKYFLWGFGTTRQVTNGKFDLYGIEPDKVVFGMGTAKTEMVGSPGTAGNAITVGSYDFLTRWENVLGEMTIYNLTVGGPSSYTSPGFRRDQMVKPDISAPARFTISSLSDLSREENGGCKRSMATGAEGSITRDGHHIAWEGTSAAAPFVAGVVALMLQKNPTLDSKQIKQILIKTARKGELVGAVPNPVFGWGAIDPVAALSATPKPKPGSGRNGKKNRRKR